ncbi:hypothetical protein ACFSTC_24220 [Nonomuraea ferruginea]
MHAAGEQVTLGALVQANFGGTLRLHGRPITPPPPWGSPASASLQPGRRRRAPA